MVNAQFGSSVAISGETVVVGALAEDSNATGVNGDENDNSAPRCRCGLRFRAQRDDLEPASLSESFQHRRG